MWVGDFNDRLLVLSELNQDIESEFQLAEIEIPFQQTDLHLRSVDQEAAELLAGVPKKTGDGPGKNSDAE